jgi:hypothetical protein
MKFSIMMMIMMKFSIMMMIMMKNICTVTYIIIYKCMNSRSRHIKLKVFFNDDDDADNAYDDDDHHNAYDR